MDGTPCFKPSQRLLPGQKILVRAEVPDPGPIPLKGPLELIYKDEHILVLNKQAGLSVHPAPSLDQPTLVNYLLAKFPEMAPNCSGERPGIVHRLDKDTSGLMVVALDQGSAHRLTRSFHDREVDKQYMAIVSGCPDPEEGRISSSLGRDPKSKVKMAVTRNGRSARTKYRVVHRGLDSQWSLVRLKIMTGRTHQIRVHLAELGHPVLGDELYGGKITASWGSKRKPLSRLIKRQLLHSAVLGFKHPATGSPCVFFSPPPKDFLRSMLYMQRRLQRVIITGSMGSGKSSLMDIMAKQGFPVFMADKCVAGLYEQGQDGWRLIRSRFGSLFIDDEQQPVNRARLAAAACADPDLLKELGHLIHPLVRHRLHEFWRKHRHSRVAFAEIPLVFEAEMRDDCDLVAGVFCPDRQRFSRLAEMRNISREQIELMEKFQLPQKVKMGLCDLVMDNSRGPKELEAKVLALTRVLRYLRCKDAGKRFRLFRQLLQAQPKSDSP